MEENIEEEIEHYLSSGRLCIATVRTNYEIENCECSSSCGDQWVTEKWQEATITEQEIIKYNIYDEDTHENLDVFLSAQEREEVIETAKEKFLEG